jgi:catechol 2,3-dioxygenase-like lactoylglutathione lyase family enzyme
MEPRVSLITLGVSDLERAIRFYRDGLGWPMSSTGDGDVAFFQIGGAILALWRRHLLVADARLPADGAGFGGFSLAHNVDSRQRVDEILAEAVKAGATIHKPGTVAEWGGYTGYFSDPDGFLWEVAWNPGFPLAADGSIKLPS